MKKSTLEIAYIERKHEGERVGKIIINDELPKEEHEAIHRAQFALNEETSSFELDYEIMKTACDILSDAEKVTKLTDEEHEKLLESALDSASVYTSTRLSYLNNNNQAEITDILKEYDSDIQTACAIWYDKMVERAMELLLEELES